MTDEMMHELFDDGLFGDEIHANEVSCLFQALPQTVSIEPDQFDQSIAVSDRVVTEARQWKTYLNALALFGFRQWLKEHAPELTVNDQQSLIWQPAYANVIEAACNVRIGEFKLCLVTTKELEATIQFPKAVMELPEFIAHFYVAVRVLEEQEQAQIWGYLRYDQWREHQRMEPLTATPTWNYAIPLSWFDRDPMRLLLHLRCLEPTAIPLPDPPSRLNHWDQLKDTIVRELSQHPSEALWQRLTWEQGVVVLTNPALLEWFYQLQTYPSQIHSFDSQPVPSSIAQSVLSASSSSFKKTTENVAMNVGVWLQNQLDEIAEQFRWVLLPPFVAVRSGDSSAVLHSATDGSMQEIELLYKQLARDGVKIPYEARCAYNDLNLGEIPLRLYAVTWSEADEWTLLLVLKLQSSNPLEHAIKLCVRDQNEVLVEEILDPKDGSNSLYTRVVGEPDEQFQVMLVLENALLTLPPFMFHRSE